MWQRMGCFGASAWCTLAFSWGHTKGHCFVRVGSVVLEPETSLSWRACWGGLGRPERVPGGFQSASSALRLRGSKFVGAHFKSGVSVSCSPLTLSVVSPIGLKSINRVCLPGVSPQGLDTQCGPQNCLLLGSTSEFVISSSYLGLPARVVGPGSLHPCPTYLYINVVFSFMFFRKICAVVSFRSFSERVVLYLPLILLYL